MMIRFGDIFHAQLQPQCTCDYFQAGLQQDIGEGGASTTQGPGLAAGSWSSEGLSNYLVCLAEEPAGSAGEVNIGVVAVETSAGDVLYGQFRCITLLPCNTLQFRNCVGVSIIDT